jgi:hypothetical protein
MSFLDALMALLKLITGIWLVSVVGLLEHAARRSRTAVTRREYLFITNFIKMQTFKGSIPFRIE